MVNSEKIRDISKEKAFKFVILIGIVSCFADMTYEGARSITGPYLATLGANATIVGFVSGFGELMGYTLRLLSGYLADKSKQYWAITILGYILNLLAVPLLALAGHWWIAAFLIILERMGKAIRVPPRDAMLSHAGQKMGMGWVFGVHEALDQAGAMIGPLIVAVVLYFKLGYQESFAVLLIPALVALSTLLFAKYLYPNPKSLEIVDRSLEAKDMPSVFWLYIVSASLIAAGYADFPLVAYHFQKTAIVPVIWIPIIYSIAMGVNIISAPILGRLYDRFGFSILIGASIISLFFAPFVFLGNHSWILVGIILWSIGVNAHETLMRAVIANMISSNKRASAYGVFNMSFGIFWFLGSFLMGALYDFSIPMLIVFSVGIQLLSIPFLLKTMRRINLL